MPTPRWKRKLGPQKFDPPERRGDRLDLEPPSGLFSRDLNAVQCFFDGSCAPSNPRGHGSYGIVVKRDGVTVFTEGKYLGYGEGMTNNVSEWAGCLAVMEYLIAQGIEEATVYGDAQIVIRQVLGQWKARRGEYLPYYRRAMKLREQLPKVRFCHIPRLLNAEADAIAGGVERRFLNHKGGNTTRKH